MTAVITIAANTVREASRNKIFYGIFFFAIAIILSSFVFTGLTIADLDRMLIDVAAGAMDFFGVLIAIFVGIGLVSREVERKTLYTVVTKPIQRSDFILGKFAGLMTVLVLSLGAMYLSFLLVVSLFSLRDVLLQPLLWYFAVTLMELAVVVAFAVLMSTFTGSAIAAFATVSFYVIGHLSSDLLYFGSRSESVAVQWLTKGLFYLLPNFDRLDVSRELTHMQPVDGAMAGLGLVYGALYVGAFLVAAIWVFSRRDFK